jgi:hypothetical protein
MALAKIVAALVDRGEDDLADEIVDARDVFAAIEAHNVDIHAALSDGEIDAELDEAVAGGMDTLVKLVKEQAKKLSTKDPKMVARAAFIATGIGLIIKHGGKSAQGNIIDSAGQKVMTELGVEGTEL